MQIDNLHNQLSLLEALKDYNYGSHRCTCTAAAECEADKQWNTQQHKRNAVARTITQLQHSIDTFTLELASSQLTSIQRKNKKHYLHGLQKRLSILSSQ